MSAKNEIIGTGVRFERLRRITGYLVGSTDKFNNAKRAEEADRLKHDTPKPIITPQPEAPPPRTALPKDRMRHLVMDDGQLQHVYMLPPDDSRLKPAYQAGRKTIGTCCGHLVYQDKQSGNLFAPVHVEHAMQQADCALDTFAYTVQTPDMALEL